jgi:hypothetical protein
MDRLFMISSLGRPQDTHFPQFRKVGSQSRCGPLDKV